MENHDTTEIFPAVGSGFVTGPAQDVIHELVFLLHHLHLSPEVKGPLMQTVPAAST